MVVDKRGRETVHIADAIVSTLIVMRARVVVIVSKAVAAWREGFGGLQSTQDVVALTGQQVLVPFLVVPAHQLAETTILIIPLQGISPFMPKCAAEMDERVSGGIKMKVCGKHFMTGEVVTLTVIDGRVSGIQAGGIETDYGNSDVWLSPGFCDLQLNGYGGYDFNINAWGAPDEVSNDARRILSLAARAGTALFCPTITTNSHEAILAAFTSLAATMEADPILSRAVPGFHLEGPYISSEDGPRGAHPLEYVRDPNWDEFRRFQDGAGGRIKICTLAPERSGALPFITKLVTSGVVVALGHTGAEPETIRDAVRAGARLSTHLGNGAHSRIARHPNYIWEQLASDELYASVIADGNHLPPSVLKCVARAKGAERLALVSDAVSLGGLKPGLYSENRFEVLPSGKIVLAGTPYLAGAGHLLDTCVANCLHFTDLSLTQVMRSVTEVPARILGLEARKGQLQVGYDADLTVFQIPESGPLRILSTISGGYQLYSRTDD